MELTGRSKIANSWFSLFQLHLLNWFIPSVMIIASICRLGKKGANIMFYKGDSWKSLARVEGHLQLGWEYRKCDGLCSVSNECLILIKIPRFKLHVLKYSECIFFSLKRTDYCTPNSTTKPLIEVLFFSKREKETNLLFSLVFMALRVKGKKWKSSKMICL